MIEASSSAVGASGDAGGPARAGPAKARVTDKDERRRMAALKTRRVIDGSHPTKELAVRLAGSVERGVDVIAHSDNVHVSYQLDVRGPGRGRASVEYTHSPGQFTSNLDVDVQRFEGELVRHGDGRDSEHVLQVEPFDPIQVAARPDTEWNDLAEEHASVRIRGRQFQQVGWGEHELAGGVERDEGDRGPAPEDLPGSFRVAVEVEF